MFALQYSQIKSACARATNLCEDDARLFDYVNEAVERLLYGGDWKGTTQTFRICVNAESCIVWPREMETPLAVAFCNSPAPIRSVWFEFSENGFGPICPENNCLHVLVDRGEVPAFDEVLDPDGDGDRRFAVYADKIETPQKYIWLEFYDPNGQWVRTQISGVWYDGERIAIPTTAGTYAYSTNRVKAGGLVRVRKDVTNGVIRLYEHNVTTTDLRPLAYYQPDEEVPMYRRSLVPNHGESCEQQSMVVAAKLRFIPVRNDSSWLMISHRGALRLACRALLHEDADQWDKAAINWGQAFQLLGMQLKHHKGAGERITLNVQSSATFGGGGIGII